MKKAALLLITIVICISLAGCSSQSANTNTGSENNPASAPTSAPTSTPVPIDITAGYASPFSQVKWDATYSTMKSMNLEASSMSNGNIQFSADSITYAGLSIYPSYVFDGEKMTMVVGAHVCVEDNNYERFKTIVGALESSFGGKFTIEYQWKDKAAEINYSGASAKELSRAVANDELVAVATMRTKVATITVRVEGIHTKYVKCGVTVNISLNDPPLTDSSLPTGLVR